MLVTDDSNIYKIRLILKRNKNNVIFIANRIFLVIKPILSLDYAYTSK